MALIKAVIIVAVGFGAFIIGPIVATVVGIGAAIWFVKSLLLVEKEIHHGPRERRDRTTDGEDYSGFVGGECFSAGEERSSGEDDS